jgi:hypothetical protein
MLPQVGDRVRVTPHILDTIGGLRTPDQVDAYNKEHVVVGIWYPDPKDHSWCAVDLNGAFGKFMLTNLDVKVV